MNLQFMENLLSKIQIQNEQAFLFISFIGESLRIPFALEVPCWLEIRNSKLSENIQPRLSKIKVWTKLDEILHYFSASLISLHYTSGTKVTVNSICKIWNIPDFLSTMQTMHPTQRKLSWQLNDLRTCTQLCKELL